MVAVGSDFIAGGGDWAKVVAQHRLAELVQHQKDRTQDGVGDIGGAVIAAGIAKMQQAAHAATLVMQTQAQRAFQVGDQYHR